MTAKQSFRLQPNKNQKAKKSASWLMGVVIGVSLLLTVGNIQIAFKSFNNRQLIPLQSELFHSSKYQPIYLGSSEKIANQDFSEIDRLAKELNYSGTSITELANILSQNATTEMEKARIIYAWTTQHITYDLPAFIDAVYNDKYPEVNAEKVLRDRTTICSGYSNLYFALAEAMNLESVIVVGYAKGATPDNERFQDVNHSWNAVKIDNSWYLLDATWGAGSVIDNKFKPNYQPYYFATAPDELINNHFPKDPGWQLLDQTYARTEFDDLPRISSSFYNLGIELVSYDNYQILAQNRVNIKLKAPQDIVAIASLKQGNQDVSETAILVNHQDDNLIINVAPPASGFYDLIIYAKEKDNSEEYQEIINYQIKATRPTPELPKVYGHFYQYQANLIEPLTRDLKPNWSTYFNLVVPQAIDVQVVNTTTKQVTPLNGYGNYFAGHVDIQSGNIIVIAKFPGDDQYWQLIEYQSDMK